VRVPTALADVVAAVEGLWPRAGAEGWDAPGLIAGRPNDPVDRILLAVDAVQLTTREAVEVSAQLLLVHHPLLLRGVTSVAEDHPKGAIIGELIRSRCALLAAHTNADVVARGTSAILADRLGLLEAVPIVPGDDPSTGLGRIGRLPEPLNLGQFAKLVSETIPATAQGVRVAGDARELIETVALCAGAGDSLLAHPAVTSADVYLTSDLRHHPASEAREAALLSTGPALVDISHWAAEWMWLHVAAEQLRAELPGVQIMVSDLRTDPWDFAII